MRDVTHKIDSVFISGIIDIKGNGNNYGCKL